MASPSTIPFMANFTSVLNQLEQERTRLASQLESLNNALSALSVKRSSRRISAAGRARIAAAQRARWAKVKGRKIVSITAHKRRMSPAARRRMGAAQKVRWAKWRKDIRSQRKQIIAANMKLTDTEAEKFWPVYEQYISELVKINGTKYALIKQYVQNGGSLTDSEAESAVKQWVDIDQSVAGLRMKYIPTFRKVLSPKNTALFYQLDRRVQLMIDFQLASSLPLIEP